MSDEPNPSAELRKIRERLDLSQDEMARRLGIPVRSYTRYENGETVKLPALVLLKAQRLKK